MRFHLILCIYALELYISKMFSIDVLPLLTIYFVVLYVTFLLNMIDSMEHECKMLLNKYTYHLTHAENQNAKCEENRYIKQCGEN